jgi:glutathione synthase/RimK-type ligase-like ATP-grasp enzyme
MVSSAGHRRPRLAVAIGEEYEEFSPDWPSLRRQLEEVGIDPFLLFWRDAEVEWGEFDLILANGAWDNIHHSADFLAWVDGVAGVTRIVNAPAIVRWNIDKRYLEILSDAGVPTVPTTWFTPPSARADTMRLPAGEFVVKPSISGGGFETARYRPDESDAARLHIDRLLAAGRTAMVQPYQAVLDTQGEAGLIFLGGQFSHAIGKSPLLRPGAGAQLSLALDAEISTITASKSQRVIAHAALAVAEQLLGPTTYARVDLVPQPDGTPAVLELELLDPALYFDTQPAAAARFARVLRRQIP